MCKPLNKKAILEFNLEDPYIKKDFIIHTKAMDLIIALDEIRNVIRGIRKYRMEEFENKEDIVDCIEDEIIRILEDRGISIYDLLY
jgi:hypothetical protein